MILADDNPGARLLTRPGEAIYNASNGTVEGNNRFQVAWLSDERRERFVADLQALGRSKYGASLPQVVFEGNAPAEISKNKSLHDLLASPLLPGEAGAGAKSKATAWLGEPIAIRPPVAAVFRRQSGSNLLIVGKDEEAPLSMMATSIVSLAAQRTAGRVIILDFGAVDAGYAEFFNRLAQRIPCPLSLGRRRELPALLGEVAAEVQRRLNEEDGTAPSWYLFLYGLQRARDLRQDDLDAADGPAQQFATIVQEGPDVGVHVVVWSDTLASLYRALDRRSIREFTMRTALQMSAEDSSSFIDTDAASKLGHYRALFFNEEEGLLEKFRPYAVPPGDWIDWAGEQLRTSPRVLAFPSAVTPRQGVQITAATQ
jgi:DNA segregation ATPase FtsK/SpoIIIE, S-DNA-T family